MTAPIMIVALCFATIRMHNSATILVSCLYSVLYYLVACNIHARYVGHELVVHQLTLDLTFVSLLWKLSETAIVNVAHRVAESAA